MEKFKFGDVKLSSPRTFCPLGFSTMFIALVIIVQLISPPGLLAQETGKHKIIGKVVSASDESALPGASIKIKGTSFGTVADLKGYFSLDVSDDDILEVSFIGFLTEEISVAGASSLEIRLIEDIASLDEVVVVGYGSVKRKDITGSISSVGSDDIRKSQAVTIEQALQGKIPGMVVQQTSGQPGGGVSVQIRGLATFGTSGGPLYVLDGIQLEGLTSMGSGSNPLAGINPSDIESIDVLKDASATAIYGSKATDGVIIITTKRGKAAAPRVSYEFSGGFQQLPKKVSVMDLQEFATFVNERNAGMGWGFDTRAEFANPEYLGKGTDWQEELFRNAPMYNHTLSISGGDTRTQYMLSGAYSSQEGIALGSGFDRVSLRLNLDNKTTDWLKIGTSLQLVNINEDVNTSGSSVIKAALEQTPDIAVQNADGSWGGATSTAGWIEKKVNPYAIALINTDDVNRKQAFGNIYAEITFVPGLVLRNEASGNFSMVTEDKFSPSYKMGEAEKLNNSGSYAFSQGLNQTLTNYLTYSHLFAEKYSLTAMAGHEAHLNKGESGSAARDNFPSNNVRTISGGDPTTASNDGTKSHSARESYFGRLNLGYGDRYLITGNFRNDGSSIYYVDNRWILSYSGALAWKINNEVFMKNITRVNELKLRIGYGLTNRPAGRDNSYLTTLSTVATGLTGTAQLTNDIANKDLKWEQTKYANIGLDGTFFNWRLNFSVDFYNRRTDDMAMQVTLPYYSGVYTGWNPGKLDAPWVNIGVVNNQGFDFRISSTNIQRPFVWKTDLTVSRNINEVIKLNAEDASLIGGKSKTVAGRSIGEFYGYVIDGVFATKEDFETHALPVKNGEPLPVGAAGGSIWYGDLMFKDIDGNGIIDEFDQTYLGSPIPKFQVGLNNSFSYKNFDLNIFFSANYGNKVFNELRMNGENPLSSYGYLKSLKNYAKLALIDPEGSDTDIDNVYVENPDTKIPGVRNDQTNDNGRISDKFIEDGSFIRCKSISLGYTFSDQLLNKVHIGSLRVYANVTNAFIITKYTGMDPEIGSWDPLNAGVDGGFYPQPRVFTFGVNMSLTK